MIFYYDVFITCILSFFFFREKLSSPEVAHYGYVLDGLPSLSDQENSIYDQFEIMKKCQLKPDFIINIRVCLFFLKDNASNTIGLAKTCQKVEFILAES